MKPIITKYTKALISIDWLPILFLTSIVLSIFYLLTPTNPLKKYGVHIEWDVGGATSAYPWINVWVEYRGKIIKPPMVFGGIEYPELVFKDIDKDGVKDIIFKDDYYKQIVAFKPPKGNNEPKFIVLQNDITWP